MVQALDRISDMFPAERQNQIRVPLADLADNLLPDFERREQLGIVIVEHNILDSDTLAGFPRFVSPAPGESSSSLALMAGVAVGHGDKSHVMPHGRPFGAYSGGAAVAIVRVRAEGDDVDLSLLSHAERHE